MDVERVKELIELMKANDLSELEIVDGDLQISLKRPYGPAPGLAVPGVLASHAPAAPLVMSAPVSGGELGTGQEGVADGLKEIGSPMVGTFYAAPSPNAEAFVKEGSTVDEEAVVCIIEAMKVMNEIQAEMSGTITELLVENGEAVEYGQPLFKIKTA